MYYIQYIAEERETLAKLAKLTNDEENCWRRKAYEQAHDRWRNVRLNSHRVLINLFLPIYIYIV